MCERIHSFMLRASRREIDVPIIGFSFKTIVVGGLLHSSIDSWNNDDLITDTHLALDFLRFLRLGNRKGSDLDRHCMFYWLRIAVVNYTSFFPLVNLIACKNSLLKITAILIFLIFNFIQLFDLFPGRTSAKKVPTKVSCFSRT